MNRRAYLGAVAATGAGLAGCADRLPAATATGGVVGTAPGNRAGDGSTPEPTPTTLAERGSPAGICGAPPRDVGIAPVVRTAVADDWSDRDVPARYGGGRLADDDDVVGLERGGRARAYPLSVLWHHEIVNDDLSGPVLVTYCPLCRSAVVAERTVAGAATRFDVTGLLWLPPGVATNASLADGRVAGAAPADAAARPERDANLVMVDDATGSYWSQLLARAICGPRTGDVLAVVPSTVATWAEWRAAHPDGAVVLPPPFSHVRNQEP